MAYESIQEIDVRYDYSIDIQNGMPSHIRIELNDNGGVAQTRISIGFIDAILGGPQITGVILGNDNRYAVVDNFTAGTTALHITNMGPGNICVLW
jgi:hypothetical protein